MFVPNQQTVAAVQFKPEMLDVENNIKTAQQFIFESALKGAKLIVLPELCMSGYTLQSKHEAVLCSQGKHGYQTQMVQEALASFPDCHVVFGYVELDEGMLYNAAACVSSRGLEGNVRKHNLFGSDNLWANASEQLFPVIQTPAGRLGIIICRDIMNNYRASYSRYNAEQKFYRKGAVDTIALLTSWGSHFGYPDSAWVELAEELDCNVIVANRVGNERDMEFKGGSAVVDRKKKIWTYGSSFTEACVVGGVVLL